MKYHQPLAELPLLRHVYFHANPFADPPTPLSPLGAHTPANLARCNALQHAAAHFNALQHTAAHCSTLQHTAAHCSTLQHTAAHCSALQHTATSVLFTLPCRQTHIGSARNKLIYTHIEFYVSILGLFFQGLFAYCCLLAHVCDTYELRSDLGKLASAVRAPCIFISTS